MHYDVHLGLPVRTQVPYWENAVNLHKDYLSRSFIAVSHYRTPQRFPSPMQQDTRIREGLGALVLVFVDGDPEP